MSRQSVVLQVPGKSSAADAGSAATVTTRVRADATVEEVLARLRDKVPAFRTARRLVQPCPIAATETGGSSDVRCEAVLTLQQLADGARVEVSRRASHLSSFARHSSIAAPIIAWFETAPPS